jgi:hypothetical protein
MQQDRVGEPVNELVLANGFPAHEHSRVSFFPLRAMSVEA